MRSVATVVAQFGVVFFLASAVWNAVYILLLGHVEEKWGDKWDNFIFGIQLDTLACLACSIGFATGCIVFYRALMSFQRVARRTVTIIAAILAYILSSSGSIGRVARLLPLDSVDSHLVAYAATGLLIAVSVFGLRQLSGTGPVFNNRGRRR